MDDDPRPLASLLALLDLERLDRDLYLGASGPGEGRLFGGLVAAQAVIAAGRSVGEGERSLHSLHAYFLRPGRHGVPLRFAVDRVRDGRSFTTRQVLAHQGGEAIFSLAASFAAPEEGIAHAGPPPPAPLPDGLPTWEDVRQHFPPDSPARRASAAVEVRVCEPEGFAPGVASQPRQCLWIRPRGRPPEDPLVHAALLVFASDRGLVATAARPHGLVGGPMVGASLDHALWFHEPACFDGWRLYASESPVARSGRGLVLGAIYREGRRVASVAQEALIRRAR